MTLPVSDPAFWKGRLIGAPKGSPHHAVFVCPTDRWQRIEAKHREILARTVGPLDSVLDAGCGWGRLLTLLPEAWVGDYRGVDASPDFVRLAEATYPDKGFIVGDLRALPWAWTGLFDWAILVSIRPMIRRNLGDAEWDKMEAELRRVAKRLLYLEYDENDEGSIE